MCVLAKSQELFKLVKVYGKYLGLALNVELKESAGNRPKGQLEQTGEETVGEEIRLMIKQSETDIECKLIAVDILKVISLFLVKEGLLILRNITK